MESLPVHLQVDLLSAAEAGDVGKVKQCLDQGVDINCSDEVGVPCVVYS
jgi:ankyrin repeat protein